MPAEHPASNACRDHAKSCASTLAKVSLAMMLALTVPAAAGAHHSFSAYNRSEGAKKVVKGQVRQFSLINPHGWLKISVPEKGKSALWSFELSSATALQAQGWRTDSIKPGDTVEISYFPLRFGSYGGLLLSVRLSNGKVLIGTSASDRGFPKGGNRPGGQH